MTVFSQGAWFIPVLYFISFIAVLSIGKGLKQNGLRLSTFFSLITFVWSLVIIVERLLEHAPGYSEHFNWLVIGQFNFTIGFEISNFTALLLFIASSMYVLVHLLLLQAAKIALPYRVVAFLSLLLCSLCSLLLADHLFMFIVSYMLIGCSIYFILSHPSEQLSYTEVVRYLLPHLVAVMLLGSIAVVMFWNIPDSSLLFTRIQTVFGGQTHAFTPQMLQLLSFFVLAIIFSSLSLTTIGKGRMRPIIYVIVGGITVGIVPLFIMYRFSELMQQVTGFNVLCLWLGVGIMIVSALLLLFVPGQQRRCYNYSLIGLLMIAYSYEAYSYMLAASLIWVIGLYLLEVSSPVNSSVAQRIDRNGSNSKAKVVLITTLFIAIGLIGLFFSNIVHPWLFETREQFGVSQLPLSLGVGIILGVALLGYIYNAKRSNMSRLDVSNKMIKGIEGKMLLVGQSFLKLLSTALFVVLQLFTVWLTYPLRRISRAAAQLTVIQNLLFIVGISLLAAIIYAVIGRYE